MSRPRVTAVIPCYNHGRFIAEAVGSCLAQTDADLTVVVVDDGSDDGTTPAACDACANERVRIIHQPNSGLPAARNRGAQGIDTPYLFFLDADDYIEPEFTRRLAQALEDADEDVSHAYCQERLVELHRGIWAVPDWDPLLLMVTNIHPVTALIRRDRFEAVGGFDDAMTEGYEDWDLWLQFAARDWRGVRVREPLFNWRRHSAQTMITGCAEHHERLYRTLVENHQALYEKHAMELLVRANALLRKGEANWIDEDGSAIVLRDTRKHLDWVSGECSRLNTEVERAQRARADAEHETGRVIDAYEAKPVVRASHAFHRVIDALPAPLAGASRFMARALKRAAPPAKR